MKLKRLLHLLSEAKEEYGDDVSIDICDVDNYHSEIYEVFGDKNAIIIGSFSGCDNSFLEFYRR